MSFLSEKDLWVFKYAMGQKKAKEYLELTEEQKQQKAKDFFESLAKYKSFHVPDPIVQAIELTRKLYELDAEQYGGFHIPFEEISEYRLRNYAKKALSILSFLDELKNGRGE